MACRTRLRQHTLGSAALPALPPLHSLPHLAASPRLCWSAVTRSVTTNSLHMAAHLSSSHHHASHLHPPLQASLPWSAAGRSGTAGSRPSSSTRQPPTCWCPGLPVTSSPDDLQLWAAFRAAWLDARASAAERRRQRRRQRRRLMASRAELLARFALFWFESFCSLCCVVKLGLSQGSGPVQGGKWWQALPGGSMPCCRPSA